MTGSQAPGRATIGFIGLGSMGAGMARRLVDAGHDVIVWNRSTDAVAELVSAGARAGATPAEALAAPVSFSMLANDAASEETLDETAAAAARGGIHVVTASISPSLADRLEDRFTSAGARYIAAPVLGRPAVAAAGQLNILAAGPADAVEMVQPYLDVLGERTWRLGERPSQANAVKAAVNYNIIHAMQALGESIAMTERQGIEPALFVELLTSTLFGGVVYQGYGREIAEQAYWPPGFHIALGRKDLTLAREIADAGGVRPATMDALFAVFDRALEDPELAEGDWGAIAEVSRRDLL